MIQNLMLGNVYWVLTDLEHRYVLGESEYRACKQCVLVGYDTINHVNIKYCFRPTYDLPHQQYILYDWECERMVFLSIDEYLHYLVKYVNGLNANIYENKVAHSFDDFLKNKIVQSQEKHPEIWI